MSASFHLQIEDADGPWLKVAEQARLEGYASAEEVRAFLEKSGHFVDTVFSLTPNRETMKPTVYYTKANSPIVAGERVSVNLIEHYRLGQSNGHRAFTSPVVTVGEDGTTFETKNSMYVQREAPEQYEPMYHPV